jgi:amino acid permease
VTWWDRLHLRLAVVFQLRLRTTDSDPADEVVVTANGGKSLNRGASDYLYKQDLQGSRTVYGLLGCVLLLLFNGWRLFLSPFGASDVFASCINVLVFVLLVQVYHVDDKQEWNSLRWTRHVTMDINNPTVTREKSLALQKGRLHGTNTKTSFCKNATRMMQFIRVWLKQ